MTPREQLSNLLKQDLAGITCEQEQDILNKYGKDWSPFYAPNPSAVLFPRTTEEVVRIVRFANEHNVGLVASGGRSGLCAGATATNGELIVSLEKMDRLIRFRKEEQTVEVEAGMITSFLSRHLENLFADQSDKAAVRDLYFPIDFAARDSSHIGGNIATNAGGIHVIHYGLTRDWVTGLRVVTGKGDILDLNQGLTKNATGYDLRHLFIGSEGTLGIITEATIRLTRRPKAPSTFLFGFERVLDVLNILEWMKAHVHLLAFEFFSNKALDYALTEGSGNITYALSQRHPYYAVVEFDSMIDPAMNANRSLREDFVIDSIVAKNLATDGVKASSPSERENFWRHRELIPTGINRHDPYKNDISVRIGDIPAFVQDLDTLLANRYPDLTVLWFGHIGDGNLHVNIAKPERLTIEAFKNVCDAASIEMYELIQRYHGSVSAEHGVGLMKKPFLGYTRSQLEIDYMRGIKRTFDPNGIMNPGKML